jgi:putative transposase
VSRLRRIEESGHAFFATTHFAKTSLPVSEDERDVVLTSIAIARSHRKFLLAAYVVMPTHCHLLFVPEAGDTYRGVMREFKARAAKRILAGGSRSGPFWQARSFDRILRNRTEWLETLEYIHWNPVKDGLVAAPSEWFWSSWRAYLPGGAPPIPVDRIELPADERAPLRFR